MAEATTWWRAVANVARQSPQQIAVSAGDTSKTYQSVVAESMSLAAWLYDQGLRPGDRLGIHLRKGIEEILATLAAARLGAVFVHVHPQVTFEQLQHIILDSGIRILITETKRAAEALSNPTINQQLTTIVAVGNNVPETAMRWPALNQGVESLDFPEPASEQLAALLYTSGSTGKPKGVMHSHENILAFASNVADYLKSTPNDRVMGLLPISFGYGLNQLLTTFSTGSTLILQKAPFPADIVKTLKEQSITGLAAIPSLWSQILSYLDQKPTELKSLRYVTNAGGKLSVENARRLRSKLPDTDIILMYGSTEALRTTYLNPVTFENKPGAMGKAIPNVKVFVLGSDGQLCGPDQPGELLHCGSHISQGYWGKPEQTAQRFRTCPALLDLPPGEKVYYSGDIVKMDRDGDYWFVSRADWMVKSGGFRFSIEEVESTLMQSEGVAEAAVFSIDDDEMGQVVHAAVSAKAGFTLEDKTLTRYCWKCMPSYMIPRAFYVWDGPLPLLPNGKIDRISILRSTLRFPIGK